MKKRILSMLLALCMVLMLIPATAFAEEPAGMKGDINGDGSVTTYDIIVLQNYLEGLESSENFPEGVLIAADFNGDGDVNYSDLTAIQRYLGLPESGITVTNGKAAACGTVISKAAEGTRVTLTADSPSDDMEFDKWIVNEGGVTLADASSATTTFTMPADPVSVTAAYKLLSAGETGTLAVTINGFEVGNTPKDITYSFASTNLGVTFSEEDILANIGWEYYYGEVVGWLLISNTEAFEAGTSYRCSIALDNKGLDTAPAVTVNGKTPEHCEIAISGGTPYALAITCELGTPASVYTITYEGGMDSEGSIPAGTKTHGVNYTLSSKTFTREGYIQIGWQDKEGKRYDLGGTYTADKDMVFYPVWDEILTLSVPFTMTVEQGGNVAPGKTDFELGLIDGKGNELTYDDEYFSAVVTTDGAGDYKGELTITAPFSWLYDMLYEGAFIWQYDDEEEGWTYDDTVWGVRLYKQEIAARSVSDVQYSLLIYPAKNTSDDGFSFNLDMNAGTVSAMHFTNTYTKSNSGTPDTGDNSHMALWIALILVSLGLIIVTGVYSKRKRSAR